MAAYYPQSSESLLNIAGVGQVKLEKYGDAFLEVIKTYCEKHKLKERTRRNRQSPSPAGEGLRVRAKSADAHASWLKNSTTAQTFKN